jgi:hypothetical protein
MGPRCAILYWKLGAIIGQWMSEQQRLEASAVGKALLSTARNLNEVSALLERIPVMFEHSRHGERIFCILAG